MPSYKLSVAIKQRLDVPGNMEVIVGRVPQNMRYYPVSKNSFGVTGIEEDVNQRVRQNDAALAFEVAAES